MNRLCLMLAGITIALVPGAVYTVAAAEENNASVQIAKEDQNPLTRFYTVRFEDNAQFGFGPDNEVLNFFRIQPLIPFKLNENWHLVIRAIIPIAHQPWPESTNGLSDIGLNFFLTPGRTGKFIWGVGPGFLLPTATDERIGTEKWSAGPAVAAAYFSGPWVIGGVIQNLWSFAGDDQRQEVNVMTFRPLINYNLPNGWYLSSSPSIVANWKADGANRWLVPLGGGFGRIFTIDNQRISALLESYYHVRSPEIGPDWQLRFQVSFLYPD
ncbi:MAG: neuromedin U [Gammaproteobacteria bacterium]